MTIDSFDEPLRVKNLIPVDEMAGDDEEDTRLLRDMYAEALSYVRSFGWCVGVKTCYFGDGIGGIVALFLFQIEVRNLAGARWHWIIVGDLPSMYMRVGQQITPRAALSRYTDGLSEWFEAASSGKLTADLMPVDNEPTAEVIELAKARVRMLRETIIPQIRDT